MRKVLTAALLTTLLVSVFGAVPALAQGGDQPQGDAPGLTIYTRYPVQEVAVGETVTFGLKLRATVSPQTVYLEVQDLPEDWTATFRGGGKIIRAVYVTPDDESSVDLRLQLPDDVAADTYRLLVVASGEGGEVELPIELIVQEKLPPSLELEVDLPMLRGTLDTTFRYNATLRNDGDEDLSVNLIAEAPAGFQVTFKSSGQDVTSIPVEANGSKRLNIEVRAYAEVPAGTYQINVLAQGGEAQATTALIAEVTGRPELSIAGVDGRLSGQAYAGRETSLKIVVRNTGSAPARNVQLSASQPSGWSVEFDPEEIAEIPSDSEVEATVYIKPAEQAVAGDYVLTVRARPEDASSESAEFRITVRTSTLWGVIGVALIAVAVFVVGMAVSRFGRR